MTKYSPAQNYPRPSAILTRDWTRGHSPSPSCATTPVPRLPSPTPPTRQTTPRLPEPVVEPDDDSLLRSCVEHYTSTDWAREQRAEPLCSATIRFISLGTSSLPPDDPLDYIPCVSRPLLLDARPPQQNANYTPPMTTPFFSSTGRTRPLRVTPYPRCPSLTTSPRASTSLC